MNPCKIQNGYLYLSKHDSLSDKIIKKWACREREEAAHVCYSSSKTDKNLGNRACKQIANAFVTVDTSLWPVTLWYFLANFVVFKKFTKNQYFISFSSIWHICSTCLACLEPLALEPCLHLTERFFVHLLKVGKSNNQTKTTGKSKLTLLMASWMVALSAMAPRKTLSASSRMSSGRSDSTSEL